ncbi:MAG: IS110 family transposase [Thermosulfidibacteraceae bacterium]
MNYISNSLIVGIDVSLSTNMATFMRDDGQEFTRYFKFSNDLSGAIEFAKRLNSLITTHNFTQLKIGIESTSLYWWHLVEFLNSDNSGLLLKPEVYLLNPNRVDAFRKGLPNLPKTDSIDSWLIAEIVRTGRLRPNRLPDMEYAPLQRLTRFRCQLVESLITEKNRALSLTFLKFSSYADKSQNPFSDIFGKTSSNLVENFTPEEIANTSVENLIKFISETSKNHFSEEETIRYVEELNKLTKKAYRLNPKLLDTVSVTLTMTLENVRYFESQIKKINKVIEREFSAFPQKQILSLVRGLGPVLSAGIVAEIGDISRFKSDKNLASYAGLVWRKHQSGKFEGDDTPLTRSGNEYLRYYLVEGANCLRMHNAEYSKYYNQKYQEARTHQHKRALVLTARKLVRLVFALLSKNQNLLGRS